MNQQENQAGQDLEAKLARIKPRVDLIMKDIEVSLPLLDKKDLSDIVLNVLWQNKESVIGDIVLAGSLADITEYSACDDLYLPYEMRESMAKTHIETNLTFPQSDIVEEKHRLKHLFKSLFIGIFNDIYSFVRNVSSNNFEIYSRQLMLFENPKFPEYKAFMDISDFESNILGLGFINAVLGYNKKNHLRYKIQDFYRMLNENIDSVSKIKNWSEATLINLEELYLMSEHLEDEIKEGMVYGKPEFDPKKKLTEWVQLYTKTIGLIEHPRSEAKFNSLFRSFLNKYNKKSQTIESFLNESHINAKLIAQFGLSLKPDLLTSLHYLMKQGIDQNERNRFVSVVKERQSNLLKLDRRVYYGLLMDLAIATNYRNQWFKGVINNEGTEKHLAFNIKIAGYLSDLFKSLDIESSISNGIKDMHRIFHEHQPDTYRKIMDEPPDYSYSKSSKSSRIRFIKSLQNHKPESFYNSLSLFYFALIEKSIRRSQIKNRSGSTDSFLKRVAMEEEFSELLNLGRIEIAQANNLFDKISDLSKDSLSSLFLNYHIQRWHLRSGYDYTINLVDLMLKVNGKPWSDYDKFTLLSSIFLLESKEYQKDYTERAVQIIEYAQTAEELMDSASLSCLSESIIRRLGSGVAGTTYHVYSREFNREMALKVLKKPVQEAEEAHILSELVHPNLVRVFYAGDTFVRRKERHAYSILMEYVDGQTLSVIMVQHQAGLGLEKAITYSDQLLEGISYLRGRGIFHRDLNLDNIKVNSQDTLKMIDFGIATKRPDEGPKDNRKYGGETDLFSWGLITYKMATGEHLVFSQTESMGLNTYSNKIKSMKNRLRDKEGRLRKQFLQKIEANVPEALREPIITALENTAEHDEAQRIDSVRSLYQTLEISSEKKTALEGIVGRELTTEEYHKIVTTVTE